VKTPASALWLRRIFVVTAASRDPRSTKITLPLPAFILGFLSCETPMMLRL